MSDSEERSGGFLRGWSRRKIEAKRQEAEPAAPEEIAPALEEAPAPEPEVIDPEQIAALPSIEEITAGFDIKPFMAKGVPAHLKNAALRRLWSVSPSVSDYFDPAVDYAWDWNAPGGVPGGGGIISEQSVAKMVKDLIGAPKEHDQASESDDEGRDVLQPEVEAASGDIEEATPVPQPVRLTTKSTPAAETAAAAQALRKTAPPTVAPRRHGGAAPE